MPRLIDADKLKEIISDTWILDRIDEQPTVNVCPYWDNESDYCALNKPSDAEPVRHGHWEAVEYGDGTVRTECSVCGYGRGLPPIRNYCPNCGAKMDEVIEDAKHN